MITVKIKPTILEADQTVHKVDIFKPLSFTRKIKSFFYVLLERYYVFTKQYDKVMDLCERRKRMYRKTAYDIIHELNINLTDQKVIVMGKCLYKSLEGKKESVKLLKQHVMDEDDEMIVTPSINEPISTTIAIVGSLAAAAGAVGGVAAGTATFLGLSAATWGWIAVGGILLSLGAGLASYFMQPRSPSFGTNGFGIDEDSPTYSWNGVTTSMSAGISIPVIYGYNKVGGNIINSDLYYDGDKHYLNLLLCLGHGQIEDIGTVRLNENPTDNFEGITLYERLGTVSQSIIPNFEETNRMSTLIGAHITEESSYTHTTTNTDVETFELHLRLPGLYESGGGGGMITWSVTYKVEYRLVGAPDWTNLGTTTISDKSRTVVKRIYRKTELTSGQYEIRISRTTDDPDTTHVGDLYLDYVNEIALDDLSYPSLALLGIRALATDQISNGTPNVTAEVKGLRITCPEVLSGAAVIPYDDYYWNADEEEYRRFDNDASLTWNGTSYGLAYNANPAWVIYDLITNAIYGLGDFIGTTDANLASFVDVAKYCDERMDDGTGTYEKRFRIDVVLDTRTKATDILAQLTAVFGGMLFFSGGEIVLDVDKIDTPAQLFGMGNIVEGSMSESWKSLKEVKNMVEIQYLDQEKEFSNDTVAVIDPSALANGDPVRKKEIRSYTNKQSYAIRCGRTAINFAKYINRMISFKAGIDGINCRAGELISFSHDVQQIGFSGRIVSGSTTTVIQIDRTLVVEAGKTYMLRIRFADDTIEERTVTNGVGSYTALTVSSAFTQTPAAFDIYAYGETGKVKKDYRVLTISRDNESQVNITALEYDANVYSDEVVTLPMSNYSSLSSEIPMVTDLLLSEELVKLKDGTIEVTINVQFNYPDLASYYVEQYGASKIYMSDDGGVSWGYKGKTYGRTFQIVGNITDGNTYLVRVVSVSRGGNIESSISTAPEDSITIVGKSARPSNISSFLVNQSRDRIFFGWDEVDDVDVWGYEIRLGDTWADGDVISFVQGSNYLTTNFRTGSNQSYWIKAIDTSGNESETAKEAVVTVDEIPFRNIVTEYSEQTAWTGIKAGTVKSGDNLVFNGEPVAHYKCNDDAASTAVDDAQDNYEATCSVNTDTIATTGLISGAMVLDGDTVNINCGDVTELNEAFEFSIAGWFKQDTLDTYDIMLKKNVDANNDLSLFTDVDGNLHLKFINASSSYEAYMDYSDVVSSGSFFHLAAVVDFTGEANTDKVKLFIDGAESTLLFSGTAPMATEDLATTDLYLGYTANSFDGTIDDIRIYNYALTSTQVTGLYNSGVGSEDTVPAGAGSFLGRYYTAEQDVGYVATFYIGIEIITAISTGRAFDDDVITRFDSSLTARFSGEDSPGSSSVHIRTSEDGSTWTTWTLWQAGDYKCRYFQLQFEMERKALSDNLLCSTFDYYSDLPDVDEKDTAITDAAGDGESVVFEKTYHVEPNVHITIVSGAAIYTRFSAKDTTGFTVEGYDATGSQQPFKFDFHAHGI